jgi:hypothetical protein
MGGTALSQELDGDVYDRRERGDCGNDFKDAVQQTPYLDLRAGRRFVKLS